VPNTVLSEDSYKIVTDTSKPLDERIAAFYSRPNWLRSLGLKRPYVEQITHMIDHFGELGLIEKREAAEDANFPTVMYVETLPSVSSKQLLTSEASAEVESKVEVPGVNLEFAQARFGGLRRVRRQS
jgi:hypothetical protein